MTLHVGPAVGAALYEVGGFLLPFLIVGAVSTILSLSLVLTIPNMTEAEDGSSNSSNGSAMLENSNGSVPNGTRTLGEQDPLLSQSQTRPDLT